MDVDEAMKALANPVRRNILAWLKDPQTHFGSQEIPLEWGVCAGKIEQKAGTCQSAMSAHLATLQRAGLLTSRKVGQWVLYKRNDEAILELLMELNVGL